MRFSFRARKLPGNIQFLSSLLILGGLTLLCSAGAGAAPEDGGQTAPAPEQGQAPDRPSSKVVLGMEFIWCPAGELNFGLEVPSEGLPENFRIDMFFDALPVQKVVIEKGFWISKYEVRQSEWYEHMATRPWQFEKFTTKSGALPVTNVSWDDCIKFIDVLNQKNAGVFRLPTEMEWEYACKAGTSSFYSYPASATGHDYYWSWSNAQRVDLNSPQETGLKLPNPWGLHDMHGNVWEWTDSQYGWRGDQTNSESAIDRLTRDLRVIRGGAFNTWDHMLISAFRASAPRDSKDVSIGFRLCLEDGAAPPEGAAGP